MQNFLHVIHTFAKRMSTAEARGCHPENFVKFLKTPFFTEHVWETASPVNIRNPSLKKQLTKVFYNKSCS